MTKVRVERRRALKAAVTVAALTASMLTVTSSVSASNPAAPPAQISPMMLTNTATTQDGQGYSVELFAPSGTTVEQFDYSFNYTPVPNSLSPAAYLPSGLYTITVSGLSAGNTVELALWFSNSLVPFEGFAANDNTFVFSQLPTNSVSTGSSQLTITVQDGGPFDGDAEANGSISLFGGPTATRPAPPQVPGPINVMADFSDPTRGEVWFTPLPTFDMSGQPAPYGDLTYTATCEAPTGTTRIEASTDPMMASPIRITGLTLGATYTCVVVASNATGPGPASEPSFPFTVPNVPDKPSLFDANPSRLPGTAEFTAMSAPMGSDITGFRITCSTTGAPSVEKTFTTNIYGTLRMTGLDPRRTYSCRAVALSALGPSVPSDPYELSPISTVILSSLMFSTFPPGSFDVLSPVSPIPDGLPTSLELPSGLFDVGVYQGSAPAATPNYVSFSIGSSSWPPQTISGFVVHRGSTWTPLPTYTFASGASIPSEGYLDLDMNQIVIRDGGAFDTDNTVNGAVHLTGGPATANNAAQAPGAPTGLSASRAVPTQASISFNPPTNDGGAAITSYTATCQSPSMPDATGVASSSPVTVSGLDGATNYQCSVRATNSVESGPASASITVVPPKTKPFSDAGTSAVISVDNGASIAVFKRPEPAPSTNPPGAYLPEGAFAFTVTDVAQGSAVPISIAYTLRPGVTVTGWAKYLGGSWVVLPANLVDVSVPGRVTITIVDGGPYDADGIANMAVSDPGGPIALITLPQPPKVTGVSATATLTSGASVSFTRITAVDGNGDPLYGALTYRATCTSTDGGATGTATGTTSPIAVSGLTARKQYRCTVTASNIEQSGPASDQSTAFTVPGVPNAPTNVETYRYPNTIDVQFQDPMVNGGAEITSFAATCTSPTAPTLTQSVSPSGSLLQKVSLLGPVSSATYSCSATARNAVDDSPPTPTVDAFPVPPTPTAVTARLAGPTQIEVSFEPVVDSLGRPLSYGVHCRTAAGSGSNAVGFGSPVTVSGLIAGPTYRCYVSTTAGIPTSISYSLESAPSNEVQTASAPGAPTSVVGTRPSPSTATITFTGPTDNGGAAIIDYTVNCTAPGGAEVSTVTSTSPASVTGLTTTASYTCTVRARNLAGTGPASSSVFLAAGAPPGAPTINTAAVTFDDDRDAIIRFTAPTSDGGAPITSYQATCTTATGTPAHTTTAAGTASPIEVGGLLANRAYRCRVTATNEAGTGPQSGQSAQFTTPTQPGRPTGAIATPSGSRQVSVAYTPPAYIGSSAINRYTLRCESSDGGVTLLGITGMSNPLVGNGLTAGKTYTCRVSAQNTFGSSVGSVPSAPFVAPGLPGVPRDVQVTITGSSAASVTFLPPADNVTYPATGYSVTCTSSNGGTAKTVTGTASPIAVTGLSTAKTYTCAVRSTNGAGTSAAVTSAAFTLPLPPTPTGVVVTTTSSTTATVAFVPGAANSSDTVTTHTATCASSTGGTTRSANLLTSPINITGLTPGATYTCTVTATAGTLPGVASAPSAPFTLPRPPAPTDVVVTMSGTLASVAFVPATANGSTAVTTHTANCTSSTGGTARSGSSLTSPITVASLTSGATYTCTVTAAAGSILGPASLPSAAFTVATVPAAPTGVTVTLDGTGLAALIGFTAPADGGSAITSYSVTCSSTATGVAARTATGVTGPLVVTGLSAGATYSCAVTARNTVGTGAAATAALTGQTAPPAPSGVSVTVPGTPGTVVVSFTPAVSGPGAQAVAWHRVTCTPTAGGTARTAQLVAGPAIVSGLAAKTAYSCVVAAGTAAGVLGSPSSAATFTTN
jgi:hypothetical protein